MITIFWAVDGDPQNDKVYMFDSVYMKNLPLDVPHWVGLKNT